IVIIIKQNTSCFMRILDSLAECIELGKSDRDFPYPEHLKGREGASELTLAALKMGISPDDILKKALMIGMKRIGEQFAEGKVFIPNLLISAKAMYASMEHLKPYFDSGEAVHRGTFVIGTVAGDLHDIGKNLVKMVMEGDGWKVIDLGTNVSSDRFLESVQENNASVLGLSALLTTTMQNMSEVVNRVKGFNEGIKIFIGGAPVTKKYAVEIGADDYFPDPHSLASAFNEKRYENK
ncbi:MAG: corrinoid protein, partial [Melioribacteraceae bacterium]|nr:corrinoid protein [Melioribacteraceae bacterium]